MSLKPGKTAIRLLLGAAVLLVVIFFAVSPVAKYIIEKKSEAWTGRKITMESLNINLLNWNITVKELRVYEFRRKDIFFSAAKIHTEISLLQMLRGRYMLKTLLIVSPFIAILQDGQHFNYDDLVKRFLSEDTLKKTPEPISEPVKYRVEAIAVSGGIIAYKDNLLHHEIVLQNFGLACPLLTWNEKNIRSTIGFTFRSGGKVFSSIALNTGSMAYTIKAMVDQVDLNLVYPYMKDYMKTSYAGGLLSSELVIKGDFDTPQAIAMKGKIGLSDFRIDDLQKHTVASWKNFDISIDSIDVASNIYNFGKIRMNAPYMLVEMYEKDNNFTRMMPSEGATAGGADADLIDYSNPFTIMAGYIKQISKDYIISNYTAADAEIHNGHIIYNDYTLEDRFTYELEEFELKSGRIDSRRDSITFTMSCLANRLGRLNAYLAFDPKDYKNMSINYTVDQMRISDFNPYSRFYVAHAFVEGLLHYASTNTIHNGMLASTNKMHIDKIEVSRRLPGKGLYTMPLRLAIVLLRDRHGNIDLDIPVEGDLNNPKYKLRKVIWKVLGNIVVKAATAPFSILAKALGTNEEELKLIRFEYLQKSFDKQQLKSLDFISQSLSSRPGLKVAMVQVASRENEKEALALFLTKKDYYLDKIAHSQKDSLSADDLKSISAISNNDSLFNIWLNARLLPRDASGLPAQLKSRQLKGEEWLSSQVDLLFEARNRFIRNYLVNEKQVDSLSLKITNTTDEKSAQFESTPRYTIDFVVEE